MRLFVYGFVFAALLFTACAAAEKQEQKIPAGSETARKPSPPASGATQREIMEALKSEVEEVVVSDEKSFPQVTDNFTIREGDVVQILVYNNPDLSMKLKVPPGGTITYPLIGKITVTGKQPAQIEEEIKQGLEKDYFRSISVTVLVEDYAMRRVYVLGSVTKAGSYEIEVGQKLTLVQAISLAGGFQEGAAKESVKLLRFADDKRHILTLSFSEIEQKGNVGKDLFLKADDIIIVPSLKKVYILGSVNRPGAYSVPTEEQLTLTKAIALAGGLTRISAPSKIGLIRTSQKGKRTAVRIDVSAILEGSTEVSDPGVEPGDIIFVPESVF